MQIVILDDDVNDLTLTSSIIHKYKKENNIDITYKTFIDVRSLLFYCSSVEARKRDTMVAILDINLIDDFFDGIHLANRLQTFCPDMLIIFCTKHKVEYNDSLDDVESFRVVQKELLKDKLVAAIDAAVKKLGKTLKNKKYIEFKYISEHMEKSINLNDVIFFYSQLRKIYFRLKTGEEEGFYCKLDELEERLKGYKEYKIEFKRINQSYLVNWDYVDSISGYDIRIGGIELRISKKYYDQV